MEAGHHSCFPLNIPNRRRATWILFRLAEQAGQFQDASSEITEIKRVIVRWQDINHEDGDEL